MLQRQFEESEAILCGGKARQRTNAVLRLCYCTFLVPQLAYGDYCTSWIWDMGCSGKANASGHDAANLSAVLIIYTQPRCRLCTRTSSFNCSNFTND